MSMNRVAIITVSDRSSKGDREDLSGPEIEKWAKKMNLHVSSTAIVPDEFERIKEALKKFIDDDINLILTTGGTGFAPRDVTPEASQAVIDRPASGFAEVMRIKSLEVTPHAMLSRAVSGIAKNSIIINLPGSPKAVTECLGFIEDAIHHAISLMRSDVTDCGSS